MFQILRRLAVFALSILASPDVDPDDPMPTCSIPKGVLLRRRLLRIRRLIGETSDPPPRRAQRSIQEANTCIVDTSPGSMTLLDSGSVVRVKQ